MKTKNIIEGLQVLETYRESPEGFNLGAEHDVIYAYPTDYNMSRKDILKMIELGWHQESLDDDGTYGLENYSLEENWVTIV